MNKQTKIGLKRLQVCPFGIDNQNNKGEDLEYFSNLHEIVYNKNHSALALALTFTNGLYCADYGESEAVSSPVSVAIQNTTLRRTISSGKFTVNILASSSEKVYLIDLPFPQDELSPFYRFRVIVRDVKSKTTLGSYDLRFISEDEYFEHRLDVFIASELRSFSDD